MTYLDEISKDFHQLRDRVQYRYERTLVKKSKVRRLAKLRRYIGRVRGEPVSKQKWMEYIFSGRLNRTPWKCKGLPYVLKAERLRLHAEAIKLFEH